MLALQFSTFSSLSVFLLLLSQTTPSIAVPSTYDQSISARDAGPIDQTLAVRDFVEGLAATDFEERDLYDRDFEERDLYERDFKERNAFKMPPSRGSRLDFAGHVIDAAGNIVGGLVGRDFEERDAIKVPRAQGSKLGFAGNVISAGGNIAGAFIPKPSKRSLEAQRYLIPQGQQN
ncbi:hypothetical protein MMC14_005094 [Varicellaria rhodocarpa]|nr:hypothetical protein [Varicellaria rhodocarpa]